MIRFLKSREERTKPIDGQRGAIVPTFPSLLQAPGSVPELDASNKLMMLFEMIQWVPYGPDALLLRFASRVDDDAFRAGRAIIAELEKRPPHGLIECVPGFTTVLLQFDPLHCGNISLIGQHVASQLVSLSPNEFQERPAKEISVRYNGEDLASLAAEKSLTVDDVIRLHSAPVYKVHLLGFSPGFPYLGGLDPQLHTPRRTSPRTHVPAGSVAIGGEHTGIYSVASPGGWQIIGHTEVAMFEHEQLAPDTDPPTLFFLEPGDRVKFVPIKT
jgi:inhibitor of KinA